MHAFLSENRDALVERWTHRMRERLEGERGLTKEQLLDTFPLMLDAILEAFGRGRGSLAEHETSAVAQAHGEQRLVLGAPIEDVVREYGLFLDVALELAEERGVALPLTDIRRLASYLSTGATEAVRRYASRRDRELSKQSVDHFAFVAHELRNPLNACLMAWRFVASTGVTVGPHGTILERNLKRLATAIDEALVDVRLKAVSDGGVHLHIERLCLRDLVEEIVRDCAAEARAKGVSLESTYDGSPETLADRRLMRAALTNVVRNAVRFTRPQGHVHVCCSIREGRAVVDVEDECGGLPPDRAEQMFESFRRIGRDRSELGLGLAKQAIEAHRGTIVVKDAPGRGCVVTLDLAALPPTRASGPHVYSE